MLTDRASRQGASKWRTLKLQPDVLERIFLKCSPADKAAIENTLEHLNVHPSPEKTRWVSAIPLKRDSPVKAERTSTQQQDETAVSLPTLPDEKAESIVRDSPVKAERTSTQQQDETAVSLPTLPDELAETHEEPSDCEPVTLEAFQAAVSRLASVVPVRLHTLALVDVGSSSGEKATSPPKVVRQVMKDDEKMLEDLARGSPLAPKRDRAAPKPKAAKSKARGKARAKPAAQPDAKAGQPTARAKPAAQPDASGLKTDKKNVHSRAYHKELAAGLKAGMSPDLAKQAAREAARKAVASMA
jgi:hypothetical protein